MGRVIEFFIVVAVLGAAAFGVVMQYQDDQQASRARAERKLADAQLCRFVLGMRGEFGVRKLIMSCAATVQLERPAHGSKRSTLAELAWKSCMPDLSPCERALP